MRAALIAAVALGAGAAHAQPAYPVHLVAAVAGDDPAIDSAILVGSSGQLYRRDASGNWRRDAAGGLSADLRAAVRAPGGTILATGAHAPMFVWQDGAWHARPLPNRGDLGAPGPGSVAAVAVGRHVYVLDKARWRRIGAAPRPVSVLWAAGPSRLWVADNAGGLFRHTSGFAAAQHTLPVGDVVVAIAGPTEAELYALSAAGTLLWLRPGSAPAVVIPPEAAGLRIDAIGPGPDGLLVAGVVTGGGTERPLLLRAAKGKLTVDGDLPALPAGDRAAIVRGDGAGGVLLASARGRLLVRRGAEPWSESTVSGALPASSLRTFPHALPARSL